MLYIPNSSHDPYYNQAFEEFVFNTYRTENILLLWRNGPAVVCGSYQNIFAEVNVPAVQKQGIAIVRRTTGGGTVFHDLGNLNYTFIKSRRQTAADYSQFLNPVIAALNRMGIPATMNRTSDIAIHGKKVSGSAQRMMQGRILHHGTLLYNTALHDLTAMANGQRSYFETKGVASVPWPVTNMIDHMADHSMSTEQFQDGLLACLKQDMPIEIHHLTAAEKQQIRDLAVSKYRTWDWTFGKSPAFTYRRDFTLNGADWHVEYRASKGIIRELCLFPEFPELCTALTGLPLDPPALREALMAFPDHETLYLDLF